VAKITGCIITIEDHVMDGGFGSALLQTLNSKGITGVEVKRIALPNKPIEHGRVEELYEKYGLSKRKIEEVLLRTLRCKSEDRIIC
jgi:1-deoxy-D-xylulose-5-phosphate synthase